MQSADFICGIVEGFYGRPWTVEQRKELFKRMNKLGLNTYMYAPKDDTKHRTFWRDLYSKEEIECLTRLIKCAKENHIDFYYALSPGLNITFSKSKDIDAIKKKMDQVSKFGCTSFALLFDDIDAELCSADKLKFKSFAHAQAHVTNEIYEHLNKPNFMFCPTEYCVCRAVPDVKSSEYLRTLGDLLDPMVGIMWTGPRVVSKSVNRSGLEELKSVLANRNRLILWDNIHANDYDPKRVFLGPFAGRDTDIVSSSSSRPAGQGPGPLDGVLSNPNCEFEANFVAIHTLAQWSRISGRGRGLEYPPSHTEGDQSLNLDIGPVTTQRNDLDSHINKSQEVLQTKNALLETKSSPLPPAIKNISNYVSAVEGSLTSGTWLAPPVYDAKEALIRALRDWLPYVNSRTPYLLQVPRCLTTTTTTNINNIPNPSSSYNNNDVEGDYYPVVDFDFDDPVTVPSDTNLTNANTGTLTSSWYHYAGPSVLPQVADSTGPPSLFDFNQDKENNLYGSTASIFSTVSTTTSSSCTTSSSVHNNHTNSSTPDSGSGSRKSSLSNMGERSESHSHTLVGRDTLPDMNQYGPGTYTPAKIRKLRRPPPTSSTNVALRQQHRSFMERYQRAERSYYVLPSLHMQPVNSLVEKMRDEDLNLDVIESAEAPNVVTDVGDTEMSSNDTKDQNGTGKMFGDEPMIVSGDTGLTEPNSTNRKIGDDIPDKDTDPSSLNTHAVSLPTHPDDIVDEHMDCTTVTVPPNNSSQPRQSPTVENVVVVEDKEKPLTELVVSQAPPSVSNAHFGGHVTVLANRTPTEGLECDMEFEREIKGAWDYFKAQAISDAVETNTSNAMEKEKDMDNKNANAQESVHGETTFSDLNARAGMPTDHAPQGCKVVEMKIHYETFEPMQVDDGLNIVDSRQNGTHHTHDHHHHSIILDGANGGSGSWEGQTPPTPPGTPLASVPPLNTSLHIPPSFADAPSASPYDAEGERQQGIRKLLEFREQSVINNQSEEGASLTSDHYVGNYSSPNCPEPMDHYNMADAEGATQANSMREGGDAFNFDAPPSTTILKDRLKKGSGGGNGSNCLTLDDATLLSDLFYLPFEHGASGQKLLDDFHWLKANALYCLSASPKNVKGKTKTHGDIKASSTRSADGLAIEGVGNHNTPTDIDADYLGAVIDIPNQVAEPDLESVRCYPRGTETLFSENRREDWEDRLRSFESFCDKILALCTKMMYVRNKAVLFEFFPYVWDLKGVITLVKAFVRWLALGSFPNRPLSVAPGSSPGFFSNTTTPNFAPPIGDHTSLRDTQNLKEEIALAEKDSTSNFRKQLEELLTERYSWNAYYGKGFSIVAKSTLATINNFSYGTTTSLPTTPDTAGVVAQVQPPLPPSSSAASPDTFTAEAKEVKGEELPQSPIHLDSSESAKLGTGVGSEGMFKRESNETADVPHLNKTPEPRDSPPSVPTVEAAIPDGKGSDQEPIKTSSFDDVTSTNADSINSNAPPVLPVGPATLTPSTITNSAATVEPTILRGGLQAEFHRMLPLDTCIDLFCHRPPYPPVRSQYLIRPYDGSRDEASVYEICRKTFDDGSDASNLFPSYTDLPGDYLTGGFLTLAPSTCFVLEDDQGLCGYVICAPDSKVYLDRLEISWIPELRSKYHLSSSEECLAERFTYDYDSKPSTTTDSPERMDAACEPKDISSAKAGSDYMEHENERTSPESKSMKVIPTFAEDYICSRIKNYKRYLPSKLLQHYPSLVQFAFLPRVDDFSIPKRMLACLMSVIKLYGSTGLYAGVPIKHKNEQDFYIKLLGFYELTMLEEYPPEAIVLGRAFY